MTRPLAARRRLVAGLASSIALPALAQFRIEITGIGATQLPVAIATLRGETGMPVSLSQVVRSDLERSGSFRMVEPPTGVDERSRPGPEELRGRGADALLAGSVTRLADGSYDIRYKLWDALRGEEHFARAATVLAADLRLAAHRIADEIYEKLTGERGVFATRIAYVVRAGRSYTLNITDADGEGGQVALTSNEAIISPAWSPNGRELAYVSFETQKAVVWVQEVASGKRSQIAAFRGSNSAPAWSPDGRELAVTLSREGPAQLHVIARDGSGTPRRIAGSPAIDTEPAYTPDGRTIYFVSDRGGGPQIYRIGAGGGSPERVTFAGSYNISPALSPDGKTLAYIARQGNVFRVTTLDVASGTIRTLTDTNDDESPTFAPNGRLILYATRANGRDVLMTTTLDGKFKTRLVTSGADMREPAWGPFGR
jgi:TolB protein